MSENRWDEPIGGEPAEQKESLREAPTEPESVLKGAVIEDRKAWRLMERLIDSLTAEQRRARRWGIFFKLLTFGYLIVIGVLLFTQSQPDLDDEMVSEHTALVDVMGPIGAGEEASADHLIDGLRQAFRAQQAQAVVLRINSPGGSPVQAGYVYDEIKRLRALNPDKRVYAVISDIGASGAYYIAAAADEIYADKASLVGSIGVISGGFGFVGLMEKLGVERRLYTSGEHKAFLDPFSEPDQQGELLWKEALDTTHRQFIEQVRAGRGERLQENDTLFSGMVWTGEQAQALGLIDGLGSSSYVAREVVGAEKIVRYGYRKEPWEQLIEKFGVSMGKTLATQLGLSGYEVR